MKRFPFLMTTVFFILLLAAILPAADKAQTHVDRGIRLCEQGDYDQAIKEFNQALQLKPKDASIHECLGIAYYAKGRNDQAIQYLTQAIKLDPRHARAYTRRANIYDTMGEYDKALGDLKQAQNLGYKVDEDFIKLIQRKAAAKKK